MVTKTQKTHRNKQTFIKENIKKPLLTSQFHNAQTIMSVCNVQVEMSVMTFSLFVSIFFLKIKILLLIKIIFFSCNFILQHGT